MFNRRKEGTLKQQLLNSINADRMAELYKGMDETGGGCVILCAIEVYSHFFPDTPLPRDFENYVRESKYSNYSDVDRLISGMRQIIEEFQLGFHLEKVLAMDTIDGLSEEDQSIVVEVGPEDMIPPHSAVLMKEENEENSYHVVPFTGQQFSHPFTNLSGIPGVKQFKKMGFRPILVYVFEKDEEPGDMKSTPNVERD